jgi:hypothetical protein
MKSEAADIRRGFLLVKKSSLTALSQLLNPLRDNSIPLSHRHPLTTWCAQAGARRAACGDPPGAGSNQRTGHRHLSQVEDNPPRVAHHPTPFLISFGCRLRNDQSLTTLGKPSLGRKLPRLLRQDEKLEPHLVPYEPVAERPCPVQSVFTFLIG